MAQDRKKLIHIHSKVANKLPKSSEIEFGEIAVNNMPIRFDTGDTVADAQYAFLRKCKSDLVANYVKDNFNGR